jgi:hypothetical protein
MEQGSMPDDVTEYATIGIKMPVEMHRKLKRLAKAEDRSASAVIRLALSLYFETAGRELLVEPKPPAKRSKARG